MKNNNSDFYNSDFYEMQAKKSFESAQVVLKMVFDLYKPKTVVDFGCGKGTWLAAAEKLGALKLKGLDGDWIEKEKMYSKKIDFESVNFEKKIKLVQKYDLAISLEVAEHLNRRVADEFIENLCNASDVVLFGAAITGQGGVNHINEQWQSYWINKFRKRGYDCIDIIRPELWQNDLIEWWYIQNTFLFIIFAR